MVLAGELVQLGRNGWRYVSQCVPGKMPHVGIIAWIRQLAVHRYAAVRIVLSRDEADEPLLRVRIEENHFDLHPRIYIAVITLGHDLPFECRCADEDGVVGSQITGECGGRAYRPRTPHVAVRVLKAD